MKLFIELENKMYEFVENNDDVNSCGKCALKENGCYEPHYDFNDVCSDLEIAMEKINEKKYSLDSNYFFKEVKKDK